MLHSKYISATLKAFTSVTVLGAVSFLGFHSCSNGDTDGGIAEDSIGTGSQVVSDGGFGATLSIELSDGTNILEVAERKSFFVTALDPNGQPLAFRRVFCDSEKGIAILEPSSNGVAFEHTGSTGRFSGVLGGVTPGSFLLECRLEEGFNLVARKKFRIEGEVPPGFEGFPGAAGGNLGGGSIQPNPETDPQIMAITFAGLGIEDDDPNGPIDIYRDYDCRRDADVTRSDIENLTFDEYKVVINNRLTETIKLTSISFEVDDNSGRGVESTRQLNADGHTIAAGAEASIIGTFTEFSFATGRKVFAGTPFEALPGTFNITFTVRGETESGEDVSVQGTASVTFGDVNNCKASGF